MALTKVSPSLFQVSNNITSTTVGGSANTISLTFDSNGVITGASNNAVSVANTAITGNITAAQITSVANTQITGNIISSQITSNPTFYGNVSVTGVIGVGGATPTTNGSGITFPASQSASTNANTLDDYEEGTWTPTASPSSGSYNGLTTAGYYVKIGRSVTVFGYWIITASGDAAGNFNVGGLPFTILNTGTYGAGSRGALMLVREDAQIGFGGQIFWNNNSTSGQMQKYDGTNPPWTTNYLYIVSGTYITTA